MGKVGGWDVNVTVGSMPEKVPTKYDVMQLGYQCAPLGEWP